MKAYVIKNKEGKYYIRYIANSYNDSGYVEFGTLDYAAMYEKRIGAENTKEFIEKNEYKFHIKDCEIVEITIAEGDLEKQLAEKDKEIKLLKCEMVEYQVENEQLRFLGCEKYIRHQVCEKIMQKVNTSDFQVFGTKALKVNKYVKQILAELEQGE